MRTFLIFQEMQRHLSYNDYRSTKGPFFSQFSIHTSYTFLPYSYPTLQCFLLTFFFSRSLDFPLSLKRISNIASHLNDNCPFINKINILPNKILWKNIKAIRIFFYQLSTRTFEHLFYNIGTL